MSSASANPRQQKTHPADPALRERDERLESLKLLVGRLAHDFNNFLVPLLGYTALIKEEVPEESTAQQYANTLETAARRTESFLDSIQLAVRPLRHFSPKTIQLNEILGETIAAWSAALPEASHLEVIQNLEPITLYADENLWVKVFQNLLANARFALAMGGKLEVSVARETLPPEEMLRLNILQPEVALVVFRDNGFGMSPAILKKACEPFFSTRTTQKTLGLGLTIAHSVALAHGGQLEVESKEDAGTTVRIWIPILKAPAPAEKPPAPPFASAAKRTLGKRILLVDDDPLVRDVIKSHLQRAHFEVLLAADGEEGLKMYQKHAADLALVITDITMPKLDGIQLFKGIRKINPEARVLMISGNMNPARELELAELGSDCPMLLKKPFNFKTFAEIVQAEAG